MTTYNTGAPVPSVDVRDLYDNAENLDNFSNGAALAYTDRKGVSRQSLAGIRAASSYQNLGAYGAGLVFTSYNQTFSYLGEFYAPSAAVALPYTTTGAGAGEIATFRSVGDALLRSDLASTSSALGASVVAGAQKTVESIAALKTLLKTTASKHARTSGYFAAGDGGASNYWLDLSDSVSADDGGSVIVAADGGRWKLQKSQVISAAQFGAVGSGDKTTNMQALYNYCYANKIVDVVFTGDLTVNDRIKHAQEVTLYGDGDVTGDGAYDLRVVSSTTATDYSRIGFTAIDTMPAFVNGGGPVVLVGDSLTTRIPNTNSENDSFWSILRNKITTDNPGVPINYVNRGIGGTTLFDLNGIPTAFLDWYTNTGLPWLSYVEDQKPSLVVIAMGMNGSSFTTNMAQLASIITKIRAFTTPPSILLVTTPVPTTDADPAFPTYQTKSNQENINGVANIVRSAGSYYGIPVLDANRMCNIARGGFDPTRSNSVNVESPTLASGGYKSSFEVRDSWSAEITLPNRAAYSGAGTLSFPVGSTVTGGGNSVVFLTLSGSFEITMALYSMAVSGSPYKAVVLGTQIAPDSPHTLRIVVANNTVQVYIATSPLDSIPAPSTLYVCGGLYYPYIGTHASAGASGTLSSIDKFSYGKSVRNIPFITNEQMWGVSDATSGTKLPYGGNGLNHPTSIGVNAIYGRALDQCSFSKRSSASSFIERAYNTGLATLSITPTIFTSPDAFFGGAKALFIYVRAYESTGSVYSTGWYRLINHGNNVWRLSTIIGLEEFTPGTVAHTIAVNSVTGEVTMTNTKSPATNAKNFIGTSFSIFPGV